MNPNYAGKKKPVAKLGDASFKKSSRKAQLAIQPSGPMIREAVVIYCDAPSVGKKKNKRGSKDPVTAEFIPGMRLPAKVSKNGSSVSAVIPANIAGYCFMLIDENGFMQFSDVAAAK